MKTVAILGSTASGKTDLAITLASRFDAAILSLDSLAIYREIDIASAKPTPRERGGIPHFGIDVIAPDEHFSVKTFIEIYRDAARFCSRSGKNLIIVGGTGFYLKMLMEGISEIPKISEATAARVRTFMKSPERAYEQLLQIDPEYARNIKKSDRYRIERGWLLYCETGISPSRYFAEHPPTPILGEISLFEIERDRAELQERIEKRTETMLERGLVDEVAKLEKKYGRTPNPMKAIGILEVLDYFDGKLSFAQMLERIVIHTRQLAKRQRTFNSTQFPSHPKGSPERLLPEISKILQG
ncbi:tRNA (adenosine(37)-N6)-dimethylallyltransferase MiaA [Hydrogenimonas urashimensis]|uniref:tRNA (adenosine(37)-N6)-dimethylallyltransferase MiaA n=1 Tax=Hydrogenimonas urashimensis TaxID=2740515 RepID=UPI0019155883|nr:tRNA (adenosine(37)-N6)-dimethylallyltransferase MiaA [Hydrogenimonas urashimensis]